MIIPSCSHDAVAQASRAVIRGAVLGVGRRTLRTVLG
jgi:hypothetical protein